MTTPATDELIALLGRSYNLPAAPSTDRAIESLSVIVIATLLSDADSSARYVVLEWSDQGPHLWATELLGCDNSPVSNQDELLDEIVIWSTNLRGVHPQVRPHPDRVDAFVLDLREV